MGHLYWKLNVHEPNDIKHGRFPRTLFSRWSKVVLHMTTVRVGCVTNSTQNIRYRKEEHFLKFNPQKWQITKLVKKKEKEKNKYVRIEICSKMSVSTLLLKLPTVSRQFWQILHDSTQFQINKRNRKLEHAISFNGPYPFIKKAPHTNISNARKNPIPKILRQLIKKKFMGLNISLVSENLNY